MIPPHLMIASEHWFPILLGGDNQVKVIVFGSINMDLVVTAPHLPRPGETLTGHSFFTAPGGKGANQAVAAARLGVETVMVGRVGNDSFAAPLLANLRNNGVDVTQVQTDMSVTSGVAFIAVDDDGENNIIIVPGANGRVHNSDVAPFGEHNRAWRYSLVAN